MALRIRWRVLALVTGVWLLGCAGGIAPRAEELRIGSWNIEQLGSPDRRSQPSRGIAQTPQDLAEHIQRAELDVLALQEIGDTDSDSASFTNRTIDQTLAILNTSPGNDWTYVLLPKKNRDESFQLTGVAWNRRKVTQVGAPLRVPVVDDPTDAFDTWQRHPHAVKLSAGEGKTDFVLIPLHMKSNVGGNVTVQQRAVEARALAEQLAAVRNHFGDQDVIILGDMNCLAGTEPGVTGLTTAGFRDLNAGDAPTTWKGGPFEPAPFDRFLVPGNQPEFAASVQQTLTPENDAAHVEHKKRLSDHMLIVTTIQVQADDDVAVGPAPSPPAVPGGTVSLDAIPVELRSGFNATTWAQNAAEHGLACRQAYRWATIQLLAGLKNPFRSADLVQTKAGGFSDKPPAVILDVDETVLDNSPYQARLLLKNEIHSEQKFNEWARLEEAPALPGAVPFVKFAASRGVKVFFVTNRPDEVKQATIGNLADLGLPASDETVLTMNESLGRGKDKVSRRAMVAREHRIVLLIGDNLGDFCAGVDTANQDERNAEALESERLVGTHWVLLPNLMYGGWQKPIRALADKRQALRPAPATTPGESPVPATASPLRISRLLPNPVGVDDEAESVTVKNLGTAPVDLTGWQLKDDDDQNQFWALSGSIAAGQEMTFVRPGTGFQLGNSGDTVRLLDPDGNVVHEVTYGGPVEAGAIVTP